MTRCHRSDKTKDRPRSLKANVHEAPERVVYTVTLEMVATHTRRSRLLLRRAFNGRYLDVYLLGRGSGQCVNSCWANGILTCSVYLFSCHKIFHSCSAVKYNLRAVYVVLCTAK